MYAIYVWSILCYDVMMIMNFKFMYSNVNYLILMMFVYVNYVCYVCGSYVWI